MLLMLQLHHKPSMLSQQRIHACMQLGVELQCRTPLSTSQQGRVALLL